MTGFGSYVWECGKKVVSAGKGISEKVFGGPPTCNLGHKHSSEEELNKCNLAEETKNKRKHDIETGKIQLDNERLHKEFEATKMQLEHQRQQNEANRKHEKEMAELEIKKSKQRTKSKICVVM